jgi:hypothetical protein
LTRMIKIEFPEVVQHASCSLDWLSRLTKYAFGGGCRSLGVEKDHASPNVVHWQFLIKYPRTQ